MSQTATKNSRNDSYLQIADGRSENLVGQTHEVQKSINTPVIDNILFSKVSPIYYRARVRLTFFIEDEFRPYFVMIKGLIEFNRSKQFSFSYNKKQGTIETDIALMQFDDLQAFLQNVLLWLNNEIKFKTVLKNVLAFENEYRKLSTAVYHTLKNISVAK